ncbi:MAG TPA: 5'/3'-nucleotidase SurE [Rikenellaceae bacterium]|nr:5'/3'-nucleotidase SurE [Rikenellaceae bacterium]
MRILITNDDGYQSKGINVLVKIMKRYGEVMVVAPKQHQSGMSMAVSIGYKPLAVKDLGMINGVRWHYVDGTPASAAKYAVDMLYADALPDLVLSGINHGSNASTAMWYSGTIGAAREAAMAGVPAIGVSIDNMSRDADFTVVEELLPAILDKLLPNLPKDRTPLYNINFPDLATDCIKGVKVCTQGVEKWINEFVTPDQLGREEEVQLEDGEKLYFMAGDVVPSPLNDEATDNWANLNGYIAITPQDLDNTCRAEYDRIKDLF